MAKVKLTRKPIQRMEGLQKAKELKQKLLNEGIAFDAVYLFGSVAQDKTHEWSDIDAAVVCAPFKKTRHEENMILWKLRRDIDIRIEPICLHPEDFQNKLFGLAQEIERTGVKV